MSSFNKVILVGRLTKDPESKFTPQGTQIAKFGLAVDRGWGKNKETDFFNVTAWQKLAEVIIQYLKKGSLVLIEGEIQTRRYETKDGDKRSSFEIVARNMQMLGGKGENTGNGGQKQSQFSQDEIDEINMDEFDASEMPF